MINGIDLLHLSTSDTTNPADYFVLANSSMFISGTRLALGPVVQNGASQTAGLAASFGLATALEVTYGSTGGAVLNFNSRGDYSRCVIFSLFFYLAS